MFSQLLGIQMFFPAWARVVPLTSKMYKPFLSAKWKTVDL